MLGSLTDRLHRRRAFAGLIALLALVAGCNVARWRQDFAALALCALPAADDELARWQQWARHYDRLFAMLAPGERVAIQVVGARSSGILLERSPAGMAARRSPFVRRHAPGVVLTLDAATANQLLATAPAGDPEGIWQMMKDRLYARQITAWSDPDVERLRRGGYLAFLRAIDTRPPGLTWPAVKALLGEG